MHVCDKSTLKVQLPGSRKSERPQMWFMAGVEGGMQRVGVTEEDAGTERDEGR